VELDARFGRLVAYLNDHVGRTRPTVALALALATREDGPAVESSPVDLCEGPLVRDGLVELEGDGPLPGLALRLPRDVLRRVVAAERTIPDATGVSLHEHERGLLGRLVLEPTLRTGLGAWV